MGITNLLFNVYYLNFSKVYEIKMMLSNVIKTDESVETDQGDTLNADLQAKMGTKFLKLFNAEVGADVKSGSTDSQKVLENFKVTMTKSLILSEVARSIHKALGSKSKLAKVNFGNYSSHDALNSLIGSPLGYIGSDGGELVKRMNESDVGLILIDEFEKADSAVFNYFLDVLENGKIVNSQAEEYDVNGYIIVFTSNISKEDFKKKISPELRSRFDYKGMFNLLTEEDKLKFVHFRVNQIVDKYKEFVSTDLPERIHGEVVGAIDVTQFKNMRDLNKKIKDTFVERIKVSV